MKKSIPNLQTEHDVISFIDKIDYGVTYFICKNKELISFIDNSLKIINESIGSKSLRYESEKLVDMLKFHNFLYDDGLYKIISTAKKSVIPELSEDSFYMVRFMNEAFNEKKQVRLYLDPSLYSYAKKLAKKDVIFDYDDESAFFIGAKKQLGIYEQIKQSFYKGEDFIKFDLNVVSIATVRCYTSTLSRMSGNKFRCNITEGFVFVYFKPVTDIQEASNKIIAALSIFKSNNEKYDFLIGVAAGFKEMNFVINKTEKPKNNIVEVVKSERQLYGKPVSEEEYVNAENWQRSSYASKYNWENDIKGDVDMYPKDARLDENFSEDDNKEPTKYNWNDEETDSDDF